MAEYLERETAVMRLMQDGCSAKNVQSIMELPAVSVPQWISVKDRLPEPDENPVLAGNAELCFVNTAWYHVATKRWELPSGIFCEVTHWMPLPEPPKGENYG
jgi:hypothetical protein